MLAHPVIVARDVYVEQSGGCFNIGRFDCPMRKATCILIIAINKMTLVRKSRRCRVGQLFASLELFLAPKSIHLQSELGHFVTLGVSHGVNRTTVSLWNDITVICALSLSLRYTLYKFTKQSEIADCSSNIESSICSTCQRWVLLVFLLNIKPTNVSFVRSSIFYLQTDQPWWAITINHKQII